VLWIVAIAAAFLAGWWLGKAWGRVDAAIGWAQVNRSRDNVTREDLDEVSQMPSAEEPRAGGET